MAIFNTDYYCSEEDELYSDGEIEHEMYNRLCQNDKSMYEDNRWEMFYHFSPLRENILNWYPFDKNSNTLEIGGGCGALTGLLVRRCSKVVSCELTMQRAKILYERHKKSDNLDVVVGNFMRIKFEKKFDYIIINGVLEYSKNIINNNAGNPFEQFLIYAKSLLKENGTILLSIENRHGLKYFNGAPEDHTGVIFDGINGYVGNNTDVRTFSKNELKRLCLSADLLIKKWYYPYPDYKFPTEIFTDDSINKIYPLTSETPFDQDRIELFDKKQVNNGFMEDGIMQYFANSFLLELSQNNTCLLDRPTYVKISNNRKREFAICTLIYENLFKVEKKALYPEAIKHISCMNESAMQDEKIHSCTYKSGVLTSVMLKNCQTLQDKLKNICKDNDENRFWSKLNEVKSLFITGNISNQIQTNDFINVFGSETTISPMHWQSGVNIDLNAENLFFENKKLIVIDNEWIFSFPIPVEYAFWRLLSQIKYDNFASKWMNDESISSFLDIDINDLNVYKKWEEHFARKYVGIRDLTNVQKNVYSVSLNDVISEKIKQNTIQSQLFLFFDNDKYEVIKGKITNNNGIWTVCFISDNISSAKAIRWDPLEGEASRIYDIDSGNLSLKQINAYSEDECQFVFTTYDPQFSVIGDWTKLSEIKISFKCEILDWTNGYFLIECERNQLKDELSKTTDELGRTTDELSKTTDELNKTTDELSKTTDELSKTTYELSKTTDELGRTTDELSKTTDELSKTTDELGRTTDELSKTTDELSKTTQELMRIENQIDTHPLRCIAKIILRKKI